VKPQSRRLSQKLMKRRERIQQGQIMAGVVPPPTPAAPPVPPDAPIIAEAVPQVPKLKLHGEWEPPLPRFRSEHHGLRAGLRGDTDWPLSVEPLPDAPPLIDVLPVAQT